MEYFERIVLNLVILLLIVVATRYWTKKQGFMKYIGYAPALIVWVVSIYLFHLGWVEILISIVGIGLFAWLIDGLIIDQSQSHTHRPSRHS